jgi:HK97 family phage prohead protease
MPMTAFAPSAVNPTRRPPPAAGGLPAMGTFQGYASLFNVPDLGKDVVLPGAFTASLAARGAAGVRMLWQHDPAQPIGVWLSLVQDGRGLFARGRLELDVARAREVYALMRDGAVDGLSIGYRAEKASRDPRTGFRRIQRVDLWEISIVTFPMLPQARVSAVKSAAGGTIHSSDNKDLIHDRFAFARDQGLARRHGQRLRRDELYLRGLSPGQ